MVLGLRPNYLEVYITHLLSFDKAIIFPHSYEFRYLNLRLPVLELVLAITNTPLYLVFFVKNVIHDFLAMILYSFTVAFNHTINRI